MPDTRKKDAAEKSSTPEKEEESQYTDMQKMMMMMQENAMKMQEQQLTMQQQIQQQMTHMMQITSGLLNKSTDQSPTIRTKRPDRPSIDVESTETDWIMFEEDWDRYKQMSMLSSTDDIRNELRAACSKEVNRMLFNFVGPNVLKGTSEKDLLNHIKSVAVRSVHKEVHRQEFKIMKQEEGETITRFTSRLKAKAMQCQFNTQCDEGSCRSQCSYADEMISSQIISGIRNSDHREKILSEMETLNTLQKLVDRLVASECSQKASGKFGGNLYGVSNSSTTAIQQSGYKKQQNKQWKPKPDSKKQLDSGQKCQGCGMQSHGTNKSMIREQDCPAWGQKCHKCKQKNHFQAVCRGTRSRTAVTKDEESDVDSDIDVSFIGATQTRSDSS